MVGATTTKYLKLKLASIAEWLGTEILGFNKLKQIIKWFKKSK